MTVIFVNLGIKASKLENIDAATLDEVQKIVAAVQAAVYDYEGSLNKFLIDDKGADHLRPGGWRASDAAVCHALQAARW